MRIKNYFKFIWKKGMLDELESEYGIKTRKTPGLKEENSLNDTNGSGFRLQLDPVERKDVPESTKPKTLFPLPEVDWKANNIGSGNLTDIDQTVKPKKKAPDTKISIGSLQSVKKGMPLEEANALTAVHNFLKINFNAFDRNQDSKVTSEELSKGLERIKGDERTKGLIRLTL